ncbi:hypothetical protein ACFGZ0_11645 [Pasteurella multocida]|uniref:hypothetical protein n=1 Tax=Pasteurella multocida TaxID=747 RepID=UPI000C197423|nr:hypothetical protein [Pasteurella multocida]MCW4598670.1 hypothetical protein [Pasteurella multocida subsp. multocida]NNI15149.1 hypothetical protein [Pasteurella multocida]NNI15158.1 hypothetical protein [Pasteurella multocida]NNI58742.1 hypothetical protein [Pasteurella multocida]NNI82607.1 hypothetical protein [Pasteurella multocida]
MKIFLAIKLRNQSEKMLHKIGLSQYFLLSTILKTDIKDIKEIVTYKVIIERIKRGKERTYSSDEIRKIIAMEDCNKQNE